jgi:hypothetical protein
MANIKFNIGVDASTGKRLKYEHRNIDVVDGQPTKLIGVISFHEQNDAEAIPANSSIIAKRSIESYRDDYVTVGRLINPTTKLYVSPGTPGAVSMEVYLQDKAINSFPNVANADPFWDLIEGVCKEIIDIRKANNEFTLI